MDATYRRDLRELNELNFARLDAKIEQLRGEMRGEMHALQAQVQADLHALKAELLKWMFLFWAGTALAGLLMR